MHDKTSFIPNQLEKEISYRKIHVISFIIKLGELHIYASISIKICSCHISSIRESEPVSKVFSKVTVPGRCCYSLISLLFDSQYQLVPVIRDGSEMPFFKREKTASGCFPGKRDISFIGIAPFSLTPIQAGALMLAVITPAEQHLNVRLFQRMLPIMN